MDWRRWASIARLTIRKMSCLNGSKKLLTQKIIFVKLQWILQQKKDHPDSVSFYHEFENLRIIILRKKGEK